MATLPMLQRRLVADPARPALVSSGGDSGLAAVGAGISNLGEWLTRADQRASAEANRAAEMLRQADERKRQEDGAAWTAQALTNDHVAWATWMDKAKETAPPGAPKFAGTFLDAFDKETDTAVQSAPDEQTRGFYKQRRFAMRSQLFEHALAFEAQSGIKQRDAQWEESIDNVARIAARDPEAGKTAAAELRALLVAAPNQQHAHAKLAKLQDSVAKSAAQGAIERDPVQALRLFDGYFGVKPEPTVLQGDQWADLNAKLAGMRFDSTRMDMLRKEAENPNFAPETQMAVRREIGRLERQAAKAISLPSAEPPSVDGKPQAGVWFVDALDPQTAWALRNRAQADVNRLQAQHLAGMADRERVAGAQVKAVADMMKDGFTPAPAVVEATRSLAAGTRFAPEFEQAVQQQTVTSAFRMMPDAQRQATLDGMRSQGNVSQWTPQQANLYETLTALDNKITEQYKADPLRAGLAQGLFPALSPLPADPRGMVQSLPERMQQVEAVRARTGKPVSPLTPEEADGLSSQLAALPPRDASLTIASLSGATGPAAGVALAQQLDKKAPALALAFAIGSARTSPATTVFGSPIGDGRYASELVLKGAQAEKDGTSTKGEKEPAVKVARWKADLTTRLADAVPAADLSAKVRDAALYIAHGFAAERGGALTEKDLQAAAEIAIGGSMIDHNGRNTVIPPGMTSSTFDERLRKVSDADIVSQTTVTVPARGNIDLKKRPSVRNPDGSISTIESMSANIDGIEVLMPTITPEGQRLTPDQAVERFRKTGEHLGKFPNAQEADAYAKALSNAQGASYFVMAGGAQVPVVDFVKTLPGQKLVARAPGQYVVLVGDRPVTNMAGQIITIGIR